MYYKVKRDTSTGYRFGKIEETIKDIKKQVKILGDELQFTDYRNSRWAVFGGFESIIFNDGVKVDTRIWKLVHAPNEYMPRKNTTLGKIIQGKLSAIPKVSIYELNMCIGWDNSFNSIGANWSNNEWILFSTNARYKIKVPDECIEITSVEYENLKK